jgi:hypothetical protein
MKKSIGGISLVLAFAMTAMAQDTPRTEMFLGYTYLRANSATNVPAFSANGGGGQFVYNFNKWIGAVADLGGVHNGNIGGAHLDTTMGTFLFGPRVTLRYSRINPYFQVLWGGVVAATSTQIRVIPVASTLPVTTDLPVNNPVLANLDDAISARIGANQTAFAMSAGGGLDIKINKHVSFRPIGLDYFLTRLQNLRTAGDNNQNNLRYTTGINFTFGAQ